VLAATQLDSATGTRRRSIRNWVAAGVLVATAVIAARELVPAIQYDYFLSHYQASIYWVSYTDGFVRRGLPGEVLRILTGGSPTPTWATVLAVILLVTATLAFLMLGWLAALAAGSFADKLLVVALVAASPSTLSLVVRDIGRYDAIGFVAMAAMVPISLSRGASPPRRLGRAAAMAAVLLAATASEEFLFAFLAPLAVLGLQTLGWTGRQLVRVAAAVVAPGAAVAVSSLAIRPPTESLVAAIGRASGAGLDVDVSSENAISSLNQTTAQGVEFMLSMSPLTIATCVALFGGCYVVTAMIVWAAMGRPGGRLAHALIATFGVAALAMSALGNDYRRWWAMAFVAAVAGLIVLAHRVSDEPVPVARPVPTLLACAALLASVVMQPLPVWPEWDETADTGFSIERTSE
jgi:hypothetical protein